MLLTLLDLIDFEKVIDDATGREVAEARWLNTDTLEYGVISQPPRFIYGTFNLVTDAVKVTAVRFDYVNMVIHVNEPPLVKATSGIVVRELHACTDCCQTETCQRIDYCPAHSSRFGEASPP